MSSKWSRQRREKRKYESYLDEGGEVKPSHTNVVTSSSSQKHSEVHIESGSDVSNVKWDVSRSVKTTSSDVSSSEFSEKEIDSDIVPSVTQQNANTSSEIQIRDWAVKHQIHHSALKELLVILRTQYDPHLPLDPRTLCKTPSNLSQLIKNIPGGTYYHFGVTNCLSEFLENISDLEGKKNIKTIYLRINCDGIPLFRSSGKQFWPLLVQFCANTQDNYSKPFPIGIFLGDSKPGNVEEYLKDFLNDMSELKSGYEFKGAKYLVTIQCFICDAPARQFLKCIKSHSGYNSCERCQQQGNYDGKITFPELNSPLRTDSNFMLMEDSDHHKGASPLLSLDVGLVSQFVLDPMHLVYLGVMRKLFHLWLKGPLPTRIGSQSKESISSKLIALSNHMPSEFNRKPRSLNELDRYKATELRAFLLYTGPVCLLNSVHENIYKNFLLLSVSIRMLSEALDPEDLQVAKKYLIAFITHFESLFGSKHVVYNIHNLCHLTDDVEKYGPIDGFSAFPFENYLGSLKRLLRKPNCALIQVINRIYEQKHSKSEKKKIKYPYTMLQHSDGPLHNNVSCRQFRALYLETFCVRLNSANQGIMVNNKVGKVVNIVQYENDPDTYIIYKLYEHYDDLFAYPRKSGSLGIYVVAQESKTLRLCSYKAIQKKYVLLPHKKDKIAALPLIHANHQ